MSNTEQATSQGSFYIKAILVNAANIRRYIDQFIIEEGLGMSAKKFMQDAARKADSIEKDIMSRVGSELAQVIRKEISDNWETMAHENIRMMALSLNDDQLRNLEEYTEQLMNNTYRPANFSDLNDLTKLLNDNIGTPEQQKLSILKENGFDIVRQND